MITNNISIPSYNIHASLRGTKTTDRRELINTNKKTIKRLIISMLYREILLYGFASVEIASYLAMTYREILITFHKKISTFVPAKRSIAAVLYSGGKSGQHRASCFLTGRRRQPVTASATENKPPRFIAVRMKP